MGGFLNPHVRNLAHSVPSDFHWAVADELLISSLEHGDKVALGPRRTLLYKCFRALHWLPLQLGLALIVGFAGVLKNWLLQFRYQAWPQHCGTEPRGAVGQYILVGFGARAEAALIESYRKKIKGKVTVVDQADIRSLASVYRVPIFDSIMSILRCLHDIRVAANSLGADYSRLKTHFVCFATTRLAPYSFHKSYWTALRLRGGIAEACFLAADTPAFAACASGIATRFLQHGLITRSALLPSFRRIDALTYYESSVFKRYLPSARIKVALARESPISIVGRDSVVIASANRPASQLCSAIPLIEYFQSIGLAVFVRAYPDEDLRRFWKEVLHSTGTRLAPSPQEMSFSGVLSDIKPLLVVSWGSTALVDSLYAGILPASLAQDDDVYVRGTAFPIFGCTLRWPRDQCMIETALTSQKEYSRILLELRQKEMALC